LWQFTASGGQVAPTTALTVSVEGPLPRKLVAKDWRELVKPKLNLAWLPIEQVFLRVVQLPTRDLAEARSMIEFQIEKLSPLPPAQVLWTFETLPSASETALTAVVVIIARSAVERFLGRLESQGFAADWLDLGFLHQLAALEVRSDGVWVFPTRVEAHALALVAWYQHGTLQHLGFVRVPDGADAASLVGAELDRMAWAGEMEGWFGSAPGMHLVADDETAAIWEPVLGAWSGKPVERIVPLAGPELAALAARRIVQGIAQANLQPSDAAARYRQAYIDRLWMRGAGALAVLYMLGVVVYFGTLRVVKFQTQRIEENVGALSGSFTNALQMKARIQVLQYQAGLKYAALDCWKSVTEALPSELTLTSMGLARGTNLNLTGRASDVTKVTDYIEALNQARIEDKPLFAKVTLRNSQVTPGAAGAHSITWNVDCELRRRDTP
jgi:hypothetical protein